MDLVVEIKNRLSIEDFISEYVTLKPAGKNFKGSSPFKAEKTPSFYVSVDKQIAWCFATSQGGDVFSMYQLLNGVDFPETLRDLAYKVGLGREWEVSKADFDPAKAQMQTNQKSNLKLLHSSAVEIYKQNLFLKKNQSILQYLKDRGIADETIAKFALGVSFGKGNELVKLLVAQKFSKQDLLEAGLAMSQDIGDKVLKDRFFERLMVPVYNEQNECIAFGGRVLDQNQNPKYLNSKETLIYKKNQILYGYNWAKAAILASREVVLVEGYFDVMALHQAGHTNVVAISGTALTELQVKLLKRQADTLFMALDSDEAGQKATLRSVKLLLKEDLKLRFIDFAKFKDVAEYLESQGSDFGILKNQSLDFMAYFKALHPQVNSENINLVLKEFFDLVQESASELQLRQFLKSFAAEYDLSFELVLRQFRVFKAKRSRSTKPGSTPRVQVSPPQDVEMRFWALALLHPKSFASISKQVYLARDIFEHFQNFELVKRAFKSPGTVQADLSEQLKIKVLEIESVQQFSKEVLLQEMNDLFKLIQSNFVKNQVSDLKKRLQTADPQQSLQLMLELQEVLKKK